MFRLCLILIFIIFNSYNLLAKELKDLSLQLKWKSTFQFAGFYVAKEKGYYVDIGINLDIREWDIGIDVVEDIANGKATYGVARPSSFINMANGKNIVYLSAIFQSSPLILLGDKSSNLKDLKELKHRKDLKIMLAKEHTYDVSIMALLFSQGIKLEDLNIINPSFDVKDLLNGKAHLMASYISNEPFVLKELGGTPVIFSPKDYGFDFYNDILIVNKNYLKENASEVEKFRKASIRGFEYAFDNIDETVDLIFDKYNGLNKSKEALRYEAKELKKFFCNDKDKPGSINYKKLEKIYDVYKLLGLVKKHVNIDKIIYTDISQNTDLTDEEIQYLKNKKVINLCADPDWLPFDKIDKNGQYKGISAEYIHLFEKKLSTKIHLIKTTSWDQSLNYAKQKTCDIISSVIKTPKRSTFLNFTTPYITYPLVGVTNMEVPFINGIEDLKGKKISTIEDFAFIEIVKNKYPDIDIEEAKSVRDGIEKVVSGEVFAFVDTLPSIAYDIQLNQFDDVKISGKVYDDWGLRIGVRDDDKMLLNIMQKAVNSVTRKEKQKILNKWVSIKFENKINHELIIKIALSSLFVLIFAILWVRKIKMKNDLLEKAQEEIEEKNQELQILASIDKLTGINNRLKLDNILEEEILRSRRYNSKFGIAIADIDFFKKVNDTYGHQAGDIVLKEISRILLQQVRNTDYVGRWGGEEFLLICLKVNEEEFYNLIEKIRIYIEKYVFPNVKKLTVSFGIATYIKNDSIGTIIKRADDALYRAKELGRNRVEKA